MVNPDDPGWRRIGPHPALAAWAEAALPLARAAVASLVPGDWRHGGTWWVGLDALTNGPDGAVAGVPLPWEVLGLPPVPLHRAQLSTLRPGYPGRDPDETEAAHRFRRDRDAAHLDGLLPEGPDKRRFLREPHAWVLGIALNDCDPGAAPLVVWEGSHRIILDAFRTACAGADDPGALDLTEVYQAARRRVFDTCRRLPLPGRPGEAVLLHRALIHGVAPWATGATAPPEGRIVAYFRPLLPGVSDWLAEGADT